MTATLHSPRSDVGAHLYTRTLMADINFTDNRYPTIAGPTPSKNQLGPPSFMSASNSDRPTRDPTSNNDEQQYLRSANQHLAWEPETQHLQRPSSKQGGSPLDLLTPQSMVHESGRSSLSYALPSSGSKRVVERYSLDDGVQQTSSQGSDTTPRTNADNPPNTSRSKPNSPAPMSSPQERPKPLLPSTPRHPSAPTSGINASSGPLNTIQYPPIMPLSASPTYNPPVSANHRAYPQQPTFITPQPGPKPVNPVYSPVPQEKEEICVECAMRDQDMADVDVTSPGVWERASDAHFEELKQRELEDEANGLVTIEDPSRPRIKGGRLTEQNVKVWLSINPREPASRQQTLTSYVKSQRALLEAETRASKRIEEEAAQIDNKMRDTFNELRRSAYELGRTTTHVDDAGGVRIKPPQSPVWNGPHGRSKSREITLLENGMIVEHVNVRKEEREAKDRKRKDEKRARKISRSSVNDASLISSHQSYSSPTDNLHPNSRYPQGRTVRPTSAFTSPHERPDLPRAYSQASFSDVHSLGSGSPRVPRFFGIKNLSAGWTSQVSLAPSGMSGSMMDMHVALQRENQGQRFLSTHTDNTYRQSKLWSSTDPDGPGYSSMIMEEKKKKKKGLAKIWGLVTGSVKHHRNGNDTMSLSRQEDDLPLTPPPPLSYLVSRGPSEVQANNNRHASSPSLPAALKQAGNSDTIEYHGQSGWNEESEYRQYLDMNKPSSRLSMHLMTSEPDLRQNAQGLPSPPSSTSQSRPTSGVIREKSLPPLPPGEAANGDHRPLTMYTYDPLPLPPGSLPAHDFLPPQAAFRAPEVRRQSLGPTATRPNVTLPASPVSIRSLGPRYDEFGLSRQSLGPHEHLQPLSLYSPTSSTKRKSRFGLGSLWGKKHRENEPRDVSVYQSSPEFQDDPLSPAYATSTSRHSALSTGGTNSNLRMSVTSRKTLEELVAQDAEFIAYRYPSNDQRLDLLR